MFTHKERWDSPKSPMFYLKWDDYCRECGDDMYAGDEAGYVEDSLLCWECWSVQ